MESLSLVIGRTDLHGMTESIPEEALLLCEVIDNPQKLPFYIETFYRMKISDEDAFRFSLIRIQVDSDLRMNEDIQKHQHRKYISRTIEKLLFSEILLENIQNVVFEGE